MANEFDDLIPRQDSRPISGDTLRMFGFQDQPASKPKPTAAAPAAPAGHSEFADLVPSRPEEPLYGSVMAEPTANRTVEQMVADAALSVREGARSVTSATLGLPANVLNLITNPIPLRLSNAAARALGVEETPMLPTVAQPEAIRGTQEQLRATNAADFAETASPRLQENRAKLAGADGAAATLALLAQQPEILADVGLGQVGQVLNVLPGAGAGANVAAGALSAAGQQADQTAGDLAADATLTPEQRTQRESDAFAASLALNALLPQIPGAQAIERGIGNKLAGEAGESTLRAATRALVGEGAQGAGSEAGDQVIQNVATGQPWSEGVGQQAAIGALLEGPLGAGAGAAENLAAKAEARGAAGNVPADATSMIQALLQQPAAPAPAAAAPTESAPPPAAPSPARDAEPTAPATPADQRWQKPVTPPAPAAREDVRPSPAVEREPADAGTGAAAPLRGEAPAAGLTATAGAGDNAATFTYSTRTRTDGSSVLVREVKFADGETFTSHMTDGGEWAKGEPSLTAFSGNAFAKTDSSPAVYASPDEALQAARDDLPGDAKIADEPSQERAPAPASITEPAPPAAVPPRSAAAPSPESPPAAATSPEPLAPRAPAAAKPAPGVSRAELVQQWRDAPTDDAKAAIAAQIAGMDADATTAPDAAPTPEPSRQQTSPGRGIGDLVNVTRGNTQFQESKATRAAVDAAVQNGSVRELLEAVSQQPGVGADQVALARKLAPIIETLGVKLKKAPANAKAGGAYDNGTRSLWIDQALPSIVLHETLHGVTSALLTNPSARKNAQVRQAVREFEDLLIHVQDQADKLNLDDVPQGLREVLTGKQGPLSNTKELLTYGMTDTRFQDWLRSLPPPRGRESMRNAWEWFKDAVAKMLGITSPRERSALDALIESGGSLVDFAEQNPKATRLAQMSESTRHGGRAVDEAPAFHGTPHEVDRFTTQKIGTGEGNQAFGWGLYFASQREIADWYRKTLTGVENIPGGKAAEEMLRKTNGDRVEAVRLLKRKGDEQAVEFMRRGHSRGNLYEVEVPDDTDLLDYDKPLSEQPEKVRKIVSDIAESDAKLWGRDAPDLSAMTGGQFYRQQAELNGPAQASLDLLAAGIPGLRYADGRTRGKDGEATHNYVIWDEDAVSEPQRLDFAARQGDMTREEFLGNPKITSNANAADLVPRAYSFLDDVKAEPFAAGDGLTAKYSPDGAAVFDGSKVVASYNSGDTLVVDKGYRRQGIGEELVYQWRTRNPGAKPAATRTRAAQNLQERVWDRIDRERGSTDFAARTPNDAYAERQTLMGKLAAQGYAQGNALQPKPAGKFVKTKESLDVARTKLQDKMLPLLRAQEAAAGGGKAAVSTVNLNDAMNSYREENLMHGRVRNSLDKVSQSLIDPIQEGLRKAGSSMAEFEDYLYAKAAPERNAEVAKINPALPDAGSGITTKQANDILAGRAPGVYSGATITPARLALFQSLEPHVREMRRQTLANMVQSGRITPALAASLTAKYPNYVAMRGKDDVLDAQRGGGGNGKGISQGTGSRIKRALGRGDQNIPKNVMGEMVGDLQRSIVDREKGKVADAFLKFALANPQPDLYTVEPVDLEWKYSDSTGEAYLGVKRRGEDMDSTIVVQHDGKPVMIRMVDERLRDAMMNVSANDMQALVRWLGALNRWRSMVLTQYNPAFGPVNIARDIHFGMVGLAAEQGPAAAARAAGHYFPAMAAAFRHSMEQTGDPSVPDARKSYDDWAAEFFEEGAATGYTNVDDVVKLQKDLIHASSSIMKLAADGKPVRATQQALKRAGAPILEAVEHFNGATENALRLASYIEQRKRGISRPRAAEYAKNLTINFNRKGQWAGLLNAVYLFYNASIQGTHAVQRVLRNPKVMTYLAGIAGLQAWMASALMGDDDMDGITTWDAIPDYVKRTSLVIPLGGKDYFALPMPFGFNLFSYGGGRLTQRAMLGARSTDPSVASDLAALLFESFAPVPVTKGYGALFGDQFGFLMGLASNTDDFGAPIARESGKQYPEPKALLGQVDTPRPYHVAAQMLAKLGGGDLDNRVPPIGWLDVEPEKLEAIVNYMTGGVGQIGSKSKRWAEQLDAGNLEGAYSIVSEMPILSRFMGRANEDRATQQRYYLERGEFQRNLDLVRDRIAKGDDPAKVLADLQNPYTAGLEIKRRKTTTRDKDTGKISRRGEAMLDPGGRPQVKPKHDSGAPADVQKQVDSRVGDINDALRSLRDPDITNAHLVEMVNGLKTKAYPFQPTLADLGLPDNFSQDAEAPTRVRNRAIKLLQEERANTQQRTLKSLEFERRLQSVKPQGE